MHKAVLSRVQRFTIPMYKEKGFFFFFFPLEEICEWKESLLLSSVMMPSLIPCRQSPRTVGGLQDSHMVLYMWTFLRVKYISLCDFLNRILEDVCSKISQNQEEC